MTVAQIAEEVGYDVEEYEPMSKEPEVLDILLGESWSIIIWLLVNGGRGAGAAIVILLVVWLVFDRRFSGGGGCSRGGGASGR